MNSQNRINFDVSGQIFRINVDIIKKGPDSGLKRLLATNDIEELRVLEIDRPAEIFSAILSWYQTGELHIPATSCPRAFLNEMEFWEISPEVLSSCCGNRLQAFLAEQDTLLNFGETISKDHIKQCYSNTSIGNLRSKIWEIVDYTQPTIVGKVYFTMTLIMILLSIFILACTSDPHFLREITNCERLEYMKSTNMDDYAIVKKAIEQFCDDNKLPNTTRKVDQPISYLRDFSSSDDMYYYDYDNFLAVSFPIESETDTTTPLPTYRNTNQSIQDFFMPPETHKIIKIPNMKVPYDYLFVMEVVTIVYFTVDILLRLFSCPQIGHYFLSVINIADAVALFFCYVHTIWSHVFVHEKYHKNLFDLLDVFQMLRSLRLFRIVANVKAGRVLAYSLRANVYDLFVLVLFLVCGVCVFSSFVFIVEHGSNIRSIPEGWYWAIVTMTTVGYGDIIPQTNLGRFLSCVCMLFGVILFAVTVPIFANNFLTLYQYADIEKHKKSLQKRKMVTRETVSTRNRHSSVAEGISEMPESSVP
ncbi:Potassium voltage-gated channel subfamily V member 2 [Mactra antiquata]